VLGGTSYRPLVSGRLYGNYPDIAAGSSQLALRLESNDELTRFFSGYAGHGYELFSLHADELAF